MSSRLLASAAVFALIAAPVFSVVGTPVPAYAQAASVPAAPAHVTAPPSAGSATATAATPAVPTAAVATPDATSAAAPAAAAPSAVITPPTGEAAAPGNPYGLDALWAQGDFVARGVLIILAIMSAGTWYILITKLLEQARLFSAAKETRTKFWAPRQTLEESLGALKQGSPFQFVAASGIAAATHHEGTLIEKIDLNTWVQMSIQRAVDSVSSRLTGGLAFLATVGSTAPFVGLFGTVWGIYHALVAIGLAGQASIDKVAGPVGEALIMTAVGLAVAVPAVLGYNWLVRRNKSGLEEVRNFAADLHGVLLGQGATIGSATPSFGSANPKAA